MTQPDIEIPAARRPPWIVAIAISVGTSFLTVFFGTLIVQPVLGKIIDFEALWALIVVSIAECAVVLFCLSRLARVRMAITWLVIAAALGVGVAYLTAMNARSPAMFFWGMPAAWAVVTTAFVRSTGVRLPATHSTDLPGAVSDSGDSAGSTDTTRLQLVSRSCTTGWRDWAHGELWIGDEGALRIERGVAATLRSGGIRRPIKGEPPRVVTGDELANLQSESKRTIWVRWADVTSAVVQRNALTDLVRLQVQQGGIVTLWWLKTDGAIGPVEAQLRSYGVATRKAWLARFFRYG